MKDKFILTAALDYFSSVSTREIVEKLESNEERGLSNEEAALRIKEFGKNTIESKKHKHFLVELLSHFKSPLVLILTVAAVISYSLGETINASIILFIIVVSIAIDFYQERDARNAAEKLKQSVKSKAQIIRDNVQIEVFHEEICLGDIIMLSAGKIVPADARLLFAKDFFVNQSSLTGESFPAEKKSDVTNIDKPNLPDLSNIVFMGSSIISGIAKAIVVKTGAATEFGKIAANLIQPETETDFSKGIKEFGYLIMKVTIVLVLFIFLINAVLKHDLLESFMFSLAVAVGLTPELLPMIMAITMSKGSAHMAKKGVIVKRLSSIPSFGSMEVLCTDKTGTITEDKIHLVKYVDKEGNNSEYLLLLAYLNSFYQTGIKNPLDDAVVSFQKVDINNYIKKDEIPFDFVRKRMSVVVTYQNRNILICKGAPEEIFKSCLINDQDKVAANKQYEMLSNDGFRVLAIATKETGADEIFTKEDECEMELKGFIAFLDPPKMDAYEMIAALNTIGVEVKIITGDNLLVTQKVCEQIGLTVKGFMQGHEVNDITDEALQRRVKDVTIFTRFSPEQKNRIIMSLKKHHHAVGYMGDGINDAPSLKTADIGISVNSATDVTKDAADIILTQKDLMVLKEGILEGRKTFGNTMKYILMDLSSNFGNMFSVAAATMFLPFLPMLPVQILINNFLYDTSQVTIPTDNVDESYIKKPQRWNLKMIYSFMFIFGLTSSIFDLLTFYLLYKYFSVDEAQFRTGWFMESLATQILVVFIIRTRLVPFKQSNPGKKLVMSVLFCLAIGWLLPYLPFAPRIGFDKLPGQVILFIIAIVAIYLFTAEFVKRFIYHRFLKNVAS
ncbi:magnesium-translocating P-type ATPase [Ginsengibacter hankyongi]|uniref:Magnesium-transporting ATPase, P-type 1 n=1 Tax=Ginsengibacter hankyongi TaxID=2607284 RepID=A0A5J5IHZ0_9BACT|nr:magnesium-translocating P-type ATPase [Ginsengibacter hankyongi]KAA9040620.1 magnesium-translocating P-type ATPase [Ginsengibacter hankyongi]